MPATPTTKSQVHAYKFVLRRMESALVRRDAVMLHEPMRGHTRATIVGVILSAALCLGFVLASVLAPAGSVKDSGIVVSKTGALFVIGQNPKRLIPVPNITSAKLLLMSTQGGGSGGDAGAPSMVDDSALRQLPHDVMFGMPNAPTLLPDPANQVDANWAVCDQATVPAAIDDPAQALAKTTVETTVLAGASNTGTPVNERKTMVVLGPDGKTYYLIYTAANPPGLGGQAVVRAKFDPQTDPSITRTLKIDATNVRRMSVGMLNAIPEVKAFAAPDVPNQGLRTQGYEIDGLTVGQVFQTATTETHFYVVLAKGVQEIPRVVAEMLRIKSGKADTIRTESPSVLSQTAGALLPPDQLDLSTYPPADVDAPIGFADAKTTCLNWKFGADKKVHTTFSVSDQVPAPTGTNTRLVQADQAGDHLHYFYMPGGKAAVVRSITSSQSIADDGTVTGPLYLVSDTGVKYGIPSAQIAQGLGLGTDYKPAPEAIMKLLPTGASLDPQSATRVFDTIPIDSSDQQHRPVSPSTGNQASSGG